jgi:hypothetical protein
MMERFEDNLDVDMNFANPQDRVPETYWNNQKVKERIGAPYHHCLPYKAIPKHGTLFGHDLSQPTKSILSEGRGLTILQPPYDTEPDKSG